MMSDRVVEIIKRVNGNLLNIDIHTIDCPLEPMVDFMLEYGISENNIERLILSLAIFQPQSMVANIMNGKSIMFDSIDVIIRGFHYLDAQYTDINIYVTQVLRFLPVICGLDRYIDLGVNSFIQYINSVKTWQLSIGDYVIFRDGGNKAQWSEAKKWANIIFGA